MNIERIVNNPERKGGLFSKQFMSLFACLFVWILMPCYSQDFDTTDILIVNKQHQLALQPEIEKKIRIRASHSVIQKVQAFKLQIQSEFNTKYKDQQLALDQRLEFACDTIAIFEFLGEYENYSAATTTIGMNWGAAYRITEFDKLLNKYYKKALSVLQTGMKSKLIRSQRDWLNYYLKEKEFIFALNNFGNHNAYLYYWPYVQEMIENRVQFLVRIYFREMHGSDTYVE